MDLKQRTQRAVVVGRLFGGWQQIGGGRLWRRLRLANHPSAVVEHRARRHQHRHCLDCALDQLRAATELRFDHDELDGRDHVANGYEPAESGGPSGTNGQCILSASVSVVFRPDSCQNTFDRVGLVAS